MSLKLKYFRIVSLEIVNCMNMCGLWNFYNNTFCVQWDWWILFILCLVTLIILFEQIFKYLCFITMWYLFQPIDDTFVSSSQQRIEWRTNSLGLGILVKFLKSSICLHAYKILLLLNVGLSLLDTAEWCSYISLMSCAVLSV